ncbi:MAG: hypothetical protein WC565_08810 [Parcubacteria group bacterium]|jgi:hypothetical protein
MFDWIANLGNLPETIATLAVFTVCLILVLRYLSKNVVEPFKVLVGNHMKHLADDQKADRDERIAMRGAIERQTEALDRQTEQFRDLCGRLKG